VRVVERRDGGRHEVDGAVTRRASQPAILQRKFYSGLLSSCPYYFPTPRKIASQLFLLKNFPLHFTFFQNKNIIFRPNQNKDIINKFHEFK